MSEQAPKCGTKTCAATAVARAFWPGQTTDFCQACLDRARGVATAMGFPLTVEPLVQVVAVVVAIPAPDAGKGDPN